VEAPAIHKTHHHKKTVVPPGGDEEAPPPPPNDNDDDDEAPPPEADGPAEPTSAPAPAKAGWFSSVAGAKKLAAARQSRGVESASDGVPEAKEPAAEETKTQAKAPPKKTGGEPVARNPRAAAPAPAAKKRSWLPSRTAKLKPVAPPAPAPAAQIGRGSAPPATLAPVGAAGAAAQPKPVVTGQPAPAPVPAATAPRAEIGRGTEPPAAAPAPAAGELVEPTRGVAEAKTEPANREARAPPAKPVAKPTKARAPAPAAKKRSWFPKSRAAQSKPAVQSLPAPAPAAPLTTRPVIGQGAAPPAEETKADDQVAIDVQEQAKSEGGSSDDEDRASTLERPTALPPKEVPATIAARPAPTRAVSWFGGASAAPAPAASARPTATRASSWYGDASTPVLPPPIPPEATVASIHTVVGRNGGRMRAGVEMDSPPVVDLPRGARVVVHERGVARTGAARCRVVAGEAQGWLSEKILAPADGVAAADEARLVDSALRLLATSAASIDWPDDGPAATPAGSRSRASSAARAALRTATTSAAFRAVDDGPVTTPAGAPQGRNSPAPSTSPLEDGPL